MIAYHAYTSTVVNITCNVRICILFSHLIHMSLWTRLSLPSPLLCYFLVIGWSLLTKYQNSMHSYCISINQQIPENMSTSNLWWQCPSSRTLVTGVNWYWFGKALLYAHNLVHLCPGLKMYVHQFTLFTSESK